jgi:hypothetical protein
LLTFLAPSENNPTLHCNLREGWIVLLAAIDTGQNFRRELSGGRAKSARDAKNESSRIDSSMTGVAEHQRRSGGFEHTAGDRKPHPAQSRF